MLFFDVEPSRRDAILARYDDLGSIQILQRSLVVPFGGLPPR